MKTFFNGLLAWGYASSTEAKTVLDSTVNQLDVSLIYEDSLSANSDHWPFYKKNIPSVCFIRLHKCYHKTSDDASVIDYAEMQVISDLSFKFLQAIDQLDEINFVTIPKTKSIYLSQHQGHLNCAFDMSKLER